MASVMGMTYGGAGGHARPGHGVRLPRRPPRRRHRRCTSVTAPGGVAPWWRSAVIYQIYVRSFADADGDGLGDLQGVRARLGHVRDLGADAIWLNPFYPSPQADAGYDVADYRDVDPRFGTLADADGHARRGPRPRAPGDRRPGAQPHLGPARLVQGRLAAPPGSRERARYLFREGRGAAGTNLPTTGAATSAEAPGPA